MQLSGDDRTAIQDLVSRYNMAHDTDDVDGWLDTFTEDATFVTGRSRSEGREELRRFFTQGGERLPNVRHITYNAVFDPIEGESDRIVMRSDLLVFRADEPPVLVLTRRYRDTLRRDDGGATMSVALRAPRDHGRLRRSTKAPASATRNLPHYDS